MAPVRKDVPVVDTESFNQLGLRQALVNRPPSRRREQMGRGDRGWRWRSMLAAATLLAAAMGSGGTRLAVVDAAVAGAAEAWGDDYYAQDGFDSGLSAVRQFQESAVPVPLNGQAGVAGVEAGTSHSLALESGSVWAWGRGTEGQLGDGSSGPGSTRKATPVEVRTNSATILSNVTAIAGGGLHSLALTGSGNVYAWGSNSNGQLGDGTTMDSPYATEVRVNSTTLLSGITAIAAGRTHSLGFKGSDGSVWAWGANSNGQLGNGTTTDSSFAVQVTDSSASNLIGVTDIAAGSAHSLAVKSDGSVWAWGYNGFGQIGDKTTTDRSRAVRVQGAAGNLATGSTTSLLWPRHRLAGGFHSLVVGSDGSVWTWGSNGHGQLGDGTTTDRSAAVQAQGPAVVGLGGVQSVGAGDFHSLALETNGTAWAWGWGSSGELGDGTLGDPTSCFCRTSAVAVVGIAQVTSLAGGGAHSLASAP